MATKKDLDTSADLSNMRSELKMLQDRLENANRIYSFISRINQMIVRTTDERSLFTEACHIAVKVGKFKMAWVGRIDAKSNKVIPIVYAGEDTKYLSLINPISVDDIPEGKGPTGSAFREGDYFISNDIQNDERMLPWQILANEAGYHSSIALPIKKDGKTIAALSLYSATKNHFDHTEISLLQEVVDDLSYAINSFEKEKHRKQIEEQLENSFLELEKINKEQSAILNTLPANIALLDKDGKIVKVNNEWLKFGLENGLDPDYSTIGADYIRVSKSSTGIDAISGELMAEGIVSILKGKSDDFSLDYPCHSPTQQRWFRAEVRPLTGNRDSGLVVMHTDITERKRAEEEIKLLINNTEESFILLDKDLKIVSFNNQFHRLYKLYLNLDVKKGDWIIDYAQPERKTIVTEIYQKVLKGHVELSEIVIPVSKDDVKSFSIKYYPAKDNTGNIFGVFITVVDITEIKKAEQLKEYEKRDKEALINSTEDLIWSVTPEYKLIAANKAFVDSIKNYFGIEVKPGDSLLLSGVFPAEYYNFWKDLYEKAAAGQSFKTEVFTASVSEENEMWTETSFNPIMNGKQVTAIACYSRNITERKKSVETIKRNEALLAEAQKLAKLGSWDYDFKADRLIWSEELYNIFGINKDSFNLTQDSFVNLIDSEYRELVINKFKDTQNTGKPFSIEYTITDSSGEQKYILERGYGKKNQSDEVYRLFGTVQDITERKQAEQQLINTSHELQRALNDLNKVMDSSLDVICAVTEKGFFANVSAACETVWGYTQKEMIGKHVLDFVLPEDHDATMATANKIMSGTNISHYENRYVRKDGSIVPISWAVKWDPIEKIRYGVARDITEKKRLEHAFELERQQFFDLFSEAPSSMGYLKGPEFIFEVANPLYLQLIGKNDIIGKKVKDVVPEIEGQGLIAILDEVYKTGESFTANEMCIRIDKNNTGKLVDHYINLMYQAHRGNTGQIDGILFFAVDVSEQVTSRKIIEENEARLNEAQAIAHMGSWEIDFNLNITVWSDTAYKILGLNKNDTVPSTELFLSFVHPEDIEEAKFLLKESVVNLNKSTHDFRFIRTDGELRYGRVEGKYEFDANGVVRRFYGIFQDITKQKKSELQIIQNESRLAEAQALAKVGNWETDLNLMNVNWSAETFRIFDVDPTNFENSHLAFLQYVHPDDVEKVNSAFFNSLELFSVNKIEHRIITKKGNEKIVEERWQIIRDKNNKPIRALGTCQDITERKIADQERMKITNDLIQRNRDLEQFAFIISHNLRAPTANIIGFTENLIDGSLTPEEEKEFLKGLAISVNKLDVVIKDLNQILQVRREIDGEKDAISFQTLINDISISIENVIYKNNVRIKTDFSQIPEIYSLKGYLHSIFFNLISNSIKYRNPTIDPVIEIRSTKESGKIKLEFTDNGLGIDLKAKGDKIFGLYKRFHSHVEGKGLGLFMVKTQVEALGGTITINSEPNKGTIFTIEFPSQIKPT